MGAAGAGGSAGAGGGAQPGQAGASCTQPSDCGSGFCVDGVCCQSACTGTCEACTQAKTGAASGTCAPVTAGTDPDTECSANVATCLVDTCNGARSCAAPDGTVCRVAGDAGCDVAETCSAGACPVDGFATAGTTCRAAAGSCDLAETCSGNSAACPADAVVDAGATCRAATGLCDVAEACSGASVDCPADSFVDAGVVCRPDAGVCDVAEACTGASAACPADGFQPTTVLCRAGGDEDGCNPPEYCAGTAATCPADVLAPTTQLCRPALGTCDLPESCDGLGTCPTSTLRRAAGTVCRQAVPGGCDVAEVCDGVSADCRPDAVVDAGVVCRAATGTCDAVEVCTGSTGACPADQLLSGGTVCRAAAGDCDAPELCSGASAACPGDAKRPATVVCRPASDGGCDVAETCSGTSDTCGPDLYQAAMTVCRASTYSCDPAEVCTGNSPLCPANVAGDAGACEPYGCVAGTLTCSTNCTTHADCGPHPLSVCVSGLCRRAKGVFVTSVGTNDSRIFIDAGRPDTDCTNLARDAGLSGTYKAWLSYSTAGGSPASGRFTQSTGPYALPGKVVIANDWVDLVDGTIQAPINRTERGVQLFAQNVHSGTNNNGTFVPNRNCNDWTFRDGGATVTQAMGQTHVTTSWSNSGGLFACDPPPPNAQVRWFCFEQ